MVNRNFSGFGREFFTDTGEYAIHMDSTPNAVRHLSLDERAVLLSCAINIDIDYFSRHSGIGLFGLGAIHNDSNSNSNNDSIFRSDSILNELEENEFENEDSDDEFR